MKHLLYLFFCCAFISNSFAQTGISINSVGTGVFIARDIGPDTSDHSPPPNMDTVVFAFAEQPPVFPGGDEALMKFLRENLHLQSPEDIAGRVLIRFVVEKDGSIAHIEVRRGLTPGLDAEAVRVVKLLPKFQPGRMQGKPVRVYFNLPIIIN